MSSPACAQRRSSLPCRLLYDAAGAELFEQITGVEDYYPTRAETRCSTTPAGDRRATSARTRA